MGTHGCEAIPAYRVTTIYHCTIGRLILTTTTTAMLPPNEDARLVPAT